MLHVERPTLIDLFLGDAVAIIQQLPSATNQTVNTTCAWPHCHHFNKSFAPNMRRVSIEPQKNLTLHNAPYQPVSDIKTVQASPIGKGNLRGRGRKNTTWMHLECIQQCLIFYSNTANYTLASFAHRVHQEERGGDNATNNFKLDARSIAIISQWQADTDRKSLSVLFENSDSSEVSVEGEVNVKTQYSAAYCLQRLGIDPGNSSSRRKFGCQRRYLGDW